MLPSAEKSEGDGEEGSVSNWFNGIVDKVQDLEIHDKIGNGMDNMKRTVGSFHNSMRDAVADLPDVSMPSVPVVKSAAERQINLACDPSSAGDMGDSARAVLLLEKIKEKFKDRLEADELAEVDLVWESLGGKAGAEDGQEADGARKSITSWYMPPCGPRDLPEGWLEEMDRLDFDLRKVVSHVGEQSVLSSVCLYIFRGLGYLEVLGADEEVFTSWVEKVARGYAPDNPYHNQVHAADVVVTCKGFLMNSIIDDLESKLEGTALLLAATVHDYAHPGRTNNYLIATKHELAIRYNDTAVLESFHVSSAFTIMQEPNCDVLKGLGVAEYTTMRKRMIELVLATDLTQHFSTVGSFKAAVEGGAMDMKKIEDRSAVLKVILKTADVSNPTKPRQIYKYWTNAIMGEFYAQGDEERERGMKCSPFMDKLEPSLIKCQMGFMDFIVAPLFQQFTNFVESKCPGKSIREAMENLTANKAIWQKVQAEYEGASALQFCPDSFF